MERYLVVCCPDLLEQSEGGREKRAFERILSAVSSLATRIETVRPGVCALPTRGPSRYFGGDQALCVRVAETLAEAVPEVPSEITLGIGVADGLFAALLAARSSASGSPQHVVVPPGGTPAFLSSWPVTVLERPDLADILLRLGIRNLGQFSSLPPRQVLARFGTDGSACHQAAGGRSGELPGLRIDTGPRSLFSAGQATGARLGPAVRQPGFWGGAAEADTRAAAVLARIQSELGPEEVVFGKLQGGRSPSDRARLVPVDSSVVANPGDDFRTSRPPSLDQTRPWPGRLPSPSPSVVLARPVPSEIVDLSGSPVLVSARVLLSSAPARVSVSGRPWSEVSGWAGPWPTDDLWWSPEHRKKVRIQLVTASGAAHLFYCENGTWWLEGTYD
jgi:hypothetical protein